MVTGWIYSLNLGYVLFAHIDKIYFNWVVGYTT
jgi:hypothetical protein